MRDIKFRAWDIDSSEMVYTNENNGLDWYFEFDKDGLNLLMPVEENYPEKRDVVIMQFTGLKDKNGVEIYCGDILSELPLTIEDEVYKCIYCDENARYLFESVHDGFTLTPDEITDLEVIGNLHSNPELLNQ